MNFIGLGIYGNTNGDGGGFEHAALEQVLPTLINPNAAGIQRRYKSYGARQRALGAIHL